MNKKEKKFILIVACVIPAQLFRLCVHCSSVLNIYHTTWWYSVCADSSPVLRQTEFSGQKLKDLCTVLLVLLSSVSHTNGRHWQHHTWRERACYQHCQPRVHHNIHPLKDIHHGNISEAEELKHLNVSMSTDTHRKSHSGESRQSKNSRVHSPCVSKPAQVSLKRTLNSLLKPSYKIKSTESEQNLPYVWASLSEDLWSVLDMQLG